jgi:hypothetical protein
MMTFLAGMVVLVTEDAVSSLLSSRGWSSRGMSMGSKSHLRRGLDNTVGRSAINPRQVHKVADFLE